LWFGIVDEKNNNNSNNNSSSSSSNSDTNNNDNKWHTDEHTTKYRPLCGPHRCADRIFAIITFYGRASPE